MRRLPHADADEEQEEDDETAREPRGHFLELLPVVLLGLVAFSVSEA